MPKKALGANFQCNISKMLHFEEMEYIYGQQAAMENFVFTDEIKTI